MCVYIYNACNIYGYRNLNLILQRKKQKWWNALKSVVTILWWWWWKLFTYIFLWVGSLYCYRPFNEDTITAMWLSIRIRHVGFKLQTQQYGFPPLTFPFIFFFVFLVEQSAEKESLTGRFKNFQLVFACVELRWVLYMWATWLVFIGWFGGIIRHHTGEYDTNSIRFFVGLWCQ